MMFASIPPTPPSEPLTWWLWLILASVVGLGILAGKLILEWWRRNVTDVTPNHVVTLLLAGRDKTIEAQQETIDGLREENRAWRVALHVSDEAHQRTVGAKLSKIEATNEAIYGIFTSLSDAGQPDHDNVASLDGQSELSDGRRGRRDR